MDLVRQHFYEVSLEYVFKVQEVQERKMFEFVEPVSEGLKPPQPPKNGGLRGEAGARGEWGGRGLQPHPAAPAQGQKVPVRASGHGAMNLVAMCTLETLQILSCGHLCRDGMDRGACW